MKILIVLLVGTLGGCIARPDVRMELEHVSHPLAGEPFGPAWEEDQLTQANVMLEWNRGRWRVEQGVGWNLRGAGGGGFYGPALTYTGRVSVALTGD